MYGQQLFSLTYSPANFSTFLHVPHLFDATMRSTLASALAFASTALGQACQTTTLTTSLPSNGTELALRSYSYCGGIFNASAYIANLDYNKIVSLYSTNAQGQSTPLSVDNFGYSNGVGDGSQWYVYTHYLRTSQSRLADRRTSL